MVVVAAVAVQRRRRQSACSVAVVAQRRRRQSACSVVAAVAAATVQLQGCWRAGALMAATTRPLCSSARGPLMMMLPLWAALCFSLPPPSRLLPTPAPNPIIMKHTIRATLRNMARDNAQTPLNWQQCRRVQSCRLCLSATLLVGPTQGGRDTCCPPTSQPSSDCSKSSSSGIY